MNLKRILTFIAFYIGLGLYVFAQNKVSLFVYGDICNSDLFIIESKVAEQVSNNKDIVLLNRSQEFLDMLTDEIVIQNSGEVSSKEMCKLRHKWGANYVIGIMAVDVRGQLMLTSKLINVTTGAELFTISNHKEINRVNDLIYISTLLGSNINERIKKLKI